MNIPALLPSIDVNQTKLLFLVYSLQFLDKLTLSYASIMGLKKDVHMSGSQYSWASSIF
jgi:ACS family allantoate permease-like MFS transporter